VIFWGTFFPLISDAITGRSASVGPPWFGRFVVPHSLVLVALSGLGPVMAWRRTTAANLRRVLLVPVGVGVALVAVLALAGVPWRPAALIMLGLAAFVMAVVVQEVSRGVQARRAMTNEAAPVALVALVGRNRRRYGGYLVHVGIAVLFVGIAASTAFRDTDDVRLAPGGRAELGGYEIEYVRPTGRLDVAPNGELEKIDLGAELRVRRGDGKPAIVRTQRSFFPSNNGELGALSRYFEGEATSEVGLRTGLRRDFWVVVSPDLVPLEANVRRGDAVFRRAEGLPEADRAVALAEALRRLVGAYRAETRPATFRVLVSPLVTWIWIGSLIVFAGGLIALWPAPARVARRVRAGYAARATQGLERA
jgi:cytochrome c-type biogenesis protein CcmF